MAKLNLDDVLATMTAQTKEDGSFAYNRFNRKNFEKVLTAMAHDPETTLKVNKISKGELKEVEEIAVGKSFRKWCKRLLEAAGVDSNDSDVVLGDDFAIPSMNDWYDFIAAAIINYTKVGNEFSLPGVDDIIPTTMRVAKVKKQKKTREARNPQSGETLGTFDYITEEHKKLVSKNKVPAYLSKKIKL